MANIRRSKPMLGTFVEVELTGDSSEDRLLEIGNRVFSEVERIERCMSFHSLDSELTEINLSAYNNWVSVSADMHKVLQQALALSTFSDGVFDISIARHLVEHNLLPNHEAPFDNSASYRDIQLVDGKVLFKKNLQIDLGGIAKGYAVDQAIACVDDDVDVVVNAGGDLHMRPWREQKVSIRVPSEAGLGLGFPMLKAALATTACYYHGGGSAIVSPIKGEAVRDERSFSVFAPSCLIADALTKIAFLSKNPSPLLKKFDARAIIIDSAGCASEL